jgi:hypothetical protein
MDTSWVGGGEMELDRISCAEPSGETVRDAVCGAVCGAVCAGERGTERVAVRVLPTPQLQLARIAPHLQQ